MVTIQRLSEFTFEEALALWNEGFQGYAMDMTFTLDQLLGRFGHDGLSAAHSVVAVVDGELAGFVLSGMTTVNGRTIGWNGGTGVAPRFRGQGVASRLIAASLDVYRENAVETAYLECLAENAPAIALYQKMGYTTFDRLGVMQCTELAAGALNAGERSSQYGVRAAHPADVCQLPFYNWEAPWQSRWNQVGSAEACIAEAADGTPVGYAVYRRVTGADGSLKSIVLYQCEVAEACDDATGMLIDLLRMALDVPSAKCSRMGFNLPLRHESFIQLLQSCGFETVAEQVHMRRELS